jgi:transcriptional regulator with XRE-family HTH domain
MHEVDTNKLRKAMIDAGIDTIEQLAEKAGINRVTAGDVVKGRIYPSSMVMEKIKIALGLTSEDAGTIFFKEKLA